MTAIHKALKDIAERVDPFENLNFRVIHKWGRQCIQVPATIGKELVDIFPEAWQTTNDVSSERERKKVTYASSINWMSRRLTSETKPGIPNRRRSVTSFQGDVVSKYSAARLCDSVREMRCVRSTSSGRRTQ